MANEGYYPKTDRDVFYGKDANIAYYDGLLSDTLNYANVSVTTAATLIKASNSSRKSILIFNNGSAILYVGITGVTASTGYEVLADHAIYLVVTDAVYGITSAGTSDVRYIEVE